jgi:hypothetical protein
MGTNAGNSFATMKDECMVLPKPTTVENVKTNAKFIPHRAQE